jgi:hypothetical protein
MSRTAALHRGFGVAAIAKAFCASRKRASGIPTFRCADTAKVVGRRDLAHDLTIRSIAHVVKYRPPEMRWESEPAGGPLTLSYELRPGGNRPGPADLWAQFNVAVERLGASLAEGRAGVCGHGRASLGSDEPRHSSPPPSARVPTRHGRRRVCSRSRPREARHCAISYFIAPAWTGSRSPPGRSRRRPQTWNRYGHLLPGGEEEAASRLDAILQVQKAIVAHPPQNTHSPVNTRDSKYRYRDSKRTDGGPVNSTSPTNRKIRFYREPPLRGS